MCFYDLISGSHLRRKGRRDVLRRCEDVGQVCSLNDPPCFLSSAAQCLAALASRRSCYVTHVLSFGKSLGGERKSRLGHCWAMLAGSAPRVVISIALNVSWCFHTIPAWLDNCLHLTAGVSFCTLVFQSVQHFVYYLDYLNLYIIVKHVA